MKSSLVFLLLAGSVAGTSMAAEFPQREIVLQVPFSPGTSADPLAREFAQVFAEVIQRSVIVENKMGAEGQIGAMSVLNAKPDGHTILFTSSSQPVYDPLLKEKLPYNFKKDFQPLCTLATTSNVLNVAGTANYTGYQDFIEQAKTTPKTFAYATSAQRIAADFFMQAAGVKLEPIPYKSSMTALTELAGQQVDAIFIDHISTAALTQSKKLKPLLIAGGKSIDSLPNVPVAGAVGLTGYSLQPWFGLYVAAKTEPATVQKLTDLLETALQSEKSQNNIRRRGLQPLVLCGSDFQKFQQAEIDKAKLAMQANQM